jgi:L-ascorbate metabolism protein UlaG (beta-lactamase superfamily)
MIPAVIKDNALLDEVKQYESDRDNFHLWWLGQSGFLLLYNGEKILLDPYLSDSLTKKYESTDKPHVRMSERVIDPSLLTGISFITSSHNHTDHLDAETLGPILKNNPQAKLIIPEANRKFVCDRLKCDADFPIGLNNEVQYSSGSFTFHGVPACHNEIELDEHGQCKFMGYVITFGKWTVYHSGDTLWFKGMEDILTPYHIDVALLPINGNDPVREVAGNLNTKEAADLGKIIGAGMVIPCHYDMFTFNTADPEDFAAHADVIGQPYTVLQHGGHFISSSLV